MWSEKLTEGSALGLGYELYAHTGVVKGSDSRSETRVEGSYTGGTTTDYGDGWRVSTPGHGFVTSTTTNFQNIYLTDDEGKDHVCQLVDFLVPCVEGQKVTMYMVAKRGKKSGTYFSAANQSTRERYNHTKGARSELFPWLSFLAALGVMLVWAFISIYGEKDTSGVVEALFLTAVAGAIVGAVFWIIAWIISFARATIAMRDGRFKAHFNHALSGEGAAPAAETA